MYWQKKKSENKIKIQFIIALKRTKRNNKFNEKNQILYTEKYKSMLRKMEKDLNKWREILCSCVRRPILSKFQQVFLYKLTSHS